MYIKDTTTMPGPDRREFLKAGLLGISAAGLAGCQSTSVAHKAVKADKGLQITRIDRTTVKVPFRKVPARNMARELPHWKYSEIVEVHLQSGQPRRRLCRDPSRRSLWFRHV